MIGKFTLVVLIMFCMFYTFLVLQKRELTVGNSDRNRCIQLYNSFICGRLIDLVQMWWETITETQSNVDGVNIHVAHLLDVSDSERKDNRTILVPVELSGSFWHQLVSVLFQGVVWACLPNQLTRNQFCCAAG